MYHKLHSECQRTKHHLSNLSRWKQSLYRFKKGRKTLKSFLCTNHCFTSESLHCWVGQLRPSETQGETWGCRTRDRGPGACRAETETDEPDPLGLGPGLEGLEMRLVHLGLCVGCMTETLWMELLPLLLLLHSELLGLVWCGQLVD